MLGTVSVWGFGCCVVCLTGCAGRSPVLLGMLLGGMAATAEWDPCEAGLGSHDPSSCWEHGVLVDTQVWAEASVSVRLAMLRALEC